MLKIINYLEKKKKEMDYGINKNGKEIYPFINYSVFDEKININYGFSNNDENDINVLLIEKKDDNIELITKNDGFSIMHGVYKTKSIKNFNSEEDIYKHIKSEINSYY